MLVLLTRDVNVNAGTIRRLAKESEGQVVALHGEVVRIDHQAQCAVWGDGVCNCLRRVVVKCALPGATGRRG